MKQWLFFLLLPAACFSQSFSEKEIRRWEAQAGHITIIRDTWGIPHIYGKTDADAVFGLLYAQCEENFMRVESVLYKAPPLSHLNGYFWYTKNGQSGRFAP